MTIIFIHKRCALKYKQPTKKRDKYLIKETVAQQNSFDILQYLI